MSWPTALGAGVCTAPLTGLIVGTAAGLCADWMRMPTREGAVGYFMVAMALLGAFVGLMLAIAFARGWIGAPVGFGKALGLAAGSILALSLVVTGIAWLTADANPTLAGRELDVNLELRYPAGVMPVSEGTYVAFVRLSNGESLSYDRLDFEKACDIDGRYVVPGKLHLTTSVKHKRLNVYLSAERNLFFTLDFGARPESKDFEWSRWIEASPADGGSATPAGQTFAVRYRVSFVEPPPPQQTPAEQEAAADAEQDAKVRALAPDAPLEEWLVFTRYGVPEARIAQVITAIRARPQFAGEMAALMSNGGLAGQDALRSLPHMQPPPTELAPAVTATGQAIARSLREIQLDPTSGDELTNGASISTRFSAWMEAARALQGKDSIDFVPQLQEIAEAARKHDQSYLMKMDVVRVASFYLQQWAGIPPLPTDPPPR